MVFAISAILWANFMLKIYKNKIVNKELLNLDFAAEQMHEIFRVTEERTSDICRDITALLKLNDYDMKSVLRSIHHNYNGAEFLLAVHILGITYGRYSAGKRKVGITIVDMGQGLPPDIAELIKDLRSMDKEDSEVPHDADEKIKNNMATETEEQ